MTTKISQVEAEELARKLLALIMMKDESQVITLVGIPRGGLVAAYLMKCQRFAGQTINVRSAADYDRALMVADSEQGPVYLVDDITVTGETLKRVSGDFQLSGYLSLLLKRGNEAGLPEPFHHADRVAEDEWVEFPWEANENSGKPEDAVRRLIEYLGDDPTREGVLDTPARVLRFYDELREGREPFNGTVFGSEADDLTIVAHVPFASLCEHHMLPYAGTMSVGYIPNGRVPGLSKIPRSIAMLSSGLTIQENLTREVGRLIGRMAGTESTAVVSRAIHSCVTMRGARVPGTEMVSSAMQGRFRNDSDLRSEFLSIIGG